jgi:rod shape-determining protein MreC
MTGLDIRQRTGWLFMAVTVGHIILISAQVQTRRGVPVLEAVTFGVFAEVQRATTSAVQGVQDSWQNYFALQQVRRENEELRTQLAQLQVQMQQERALAQQSRTLQDLLALQQQVALETAGARVIGASASAEFRTMTIDKGTTSGFKPDMAVISPGGVVGRVIMPSPRASKVQLLIDRNAAAGALVERSRAQGVVIGTGTDGLRMDYVSSTADIKVGDRVVTSGIDGIYPKGFVIGQIESIERTGGAFGGIVVRPAVDFAALEGVLVVLTAPPIAEAEAEARQAGVDLESEGSDLEPRTIDLRSGVVVP